MQADDVGLSQHLVEHAEARTDHVLLRLAQAQHIEINHLHVEGAGHASNLFADGAKADDA